MVELIRGFLVDLWRLPLFFQLALLWMAGAAGWQWWKHHKQAEIVAASVAWPCYPARVVCAQVSDRKSQGEDGPSYYEGLLTYSYTVPGQELEVGEHRKRFDAEEDADAWARGLRDTFVQVRVDPADDTRAVWEETEVLVFPRADGAFFDRSVPVTAEFWGIENLAAYIVLCASGIGALFALWIHVTSLMGTPAVTPERDGLVSSGMHIGAMICGLSSGMIAAKRNGSGAKRALRWAAKQFSVDTPLIKMLSAYVTAVFLFGWVKMASKDGAADKWGNLMFSAVWRCFT